MKILCFCQNWQALFMSKVYWITDYLNVKYVETVPNENSSNLPKCRPIENFWSILKSIAYENNWQANSHQQLEQRIKYHLI